MRAPSFSQVTNGRSGERTSSRDPCFIAHAVRWPPAFGASSSFGRFAASRCGTTGRRGRPATGNGRALLTTAPRGARGKDAGRLLALFPGYRFTFAEGDAPGDLPGGFWGKESEGAAIGSLFADGDVADVAFGVSILGDSLTEIPGVDGSWEYRAAAIVEARITSSVGEDTIVAASAEAYILRVDSTDDEWKIATKRPRRRERRAAPAHSVGRGEASTIFLASRANGHGHHPLHLPHGAERPWRSDHAPARDDTDQNRFFAIDVSCATVRRDASGPPPSSGWGGDRHYRVGSASSHTFRERERR
jgi:hypothetical protein